MTKGRVGGSSLRAELATEFSQNAHEIETALVTKKDQEPKRMTIQFSAEQFAQLEELARVQNISQAEALRKSLATEFYLRKSMSEGNQILLKGQDTLRELVLR
jgi:hypothetical protein